MKNNITPYLFGENHVRVAEKNGEPQFVISDVCKAIDITNPSDVVKRLHQDDLSTTEVIDSLGRKQTANTCNESGLYMLIFQSRKTVARDFTRWVTSEVLPAIRRTGCYGSHHQNYLALIKDQISLGVSPDLAAKNALALSPDRKDLPLLDPKTEPLLPEMAEELLQHMTPGLEYTITNLASYLTRRHPAMRSKTLASNCSSIGKLMEKARQLGRVDKVPGRNASYLRLPDVIDIAEGR